MLGVAALGEPQAMELVAMFKALGDPVRLRLLSLIASHPDREACVCEISATLTFASQ
jgi:ArsR family transcriptional regulator